MSNVLYITRSFPHKSETFIINQIITAIDYGYNVKVLTYKYLGKNNSSQGELYSFYELEDKTKLINYKPPKNKIHRYLKAIYLYFKYFKRLKKATNVSLKKQLLIVSFKINFFKKYQRVTTIHIHFGNSSYDVIQMKKIGVLDAKVIISFHGHDAHWSNNEEFINKKINYTDTFKYADIITVNSEYIKSKLLNLNCPKDKIKVLPMGIDVDIFKRKTTGNKRQKEIHRLISVGRLVEIKGHSLAVKAVKRLVDSGYKVEYIIIGEGHLLSKLTKLIDTLQLNNYVKLLGYRNQNSVLGYLQESDLFLMSSTKDSKNREEAQGQVSAEAQATGLPVIAFDSGGVNETLIDNKTGLLVKDKDVEAYFRAIKYLLDNETVREKMSVNALKYSRDKFNLRTNTELLFSYYQ